MGNDKDLENNLQNEESKINEDKELKPEPINLEEFQINIPNLEEFEKLKEDNKTLKNELLKVLADGENLRKRTAKQVEDAAKFALNGFAKDLINVLENLYRATNIIADESNNDALKQVLEGVEITKKELISIFNKNGITRIMPELGSVYDHNLHQAVTNAPNPNLETGQIMDVMQAGYIVHDRLLRPAMVIVVKN